MYEVRVMTIPPVLKEVVGRYDTVDESLQTIKTLMIRNGYNLEDFDLENLKTRKLLKIGIKDVA